nr:E3 ubiquitin-protein ligase CHIP isoform X2 [Lolium perenne]
MSPAADGAAASKRQAELLKQEGNSFFKKDRISAAIDAYTGAIALCQNVAVYWTNRALCYKRRNEWAKVEEDCRMAIHYDSHSVKSLELGRGAHPASYMVEEIWQELSKAKYIEWEGLSKMRSSQLHKLKATCKEALRNYNSLDNPAVDVSEEHLNELDDVFRKAAKADTPTEVPDHLCCKITLDVFRDPVITPSGITYERAVILDHLNRVGKFDPVTREALEPHQLIPNLAVKEAVDVFLSEHGWAYKIR